MIAALYVQTGGCYYGLPDVDPWDEKRDARLYDGPWPVVAHPPCQRWGKYWAGSPLVIARTGLRKVKGDDDGCFDAALRAVKRFGGILEHPLASAAWDRFGLLRPPNRGWGSAGLFDGGWTCQIEQGWYGHWARKPTWLYAYGVELPSLRWGKAPGKFDLIDRGNKFTGDEKRRASLVKRGMMATRGGGGNDAERAATPIPFRDLLIDIAKSALAVSSIGE